MYHPMQILSISNGVNNFVKHIKYEVTLILTHSFLLLQEILFIHDFPL